MEAIIERLRLITFPEKHLWDRDREDEFDLNPDALTDQMRLTLVAKLIDHLARSVMSSSRDSLSAPLRAILDALSIHE